MEIVGGGRNDLKYLGILERPRIQKCQAELSRVMCRYSQHFLENCVQFSLKEIPNIKIDDTPLFDEIRRLNEKNLNSDKLEQWGNQHVEIHERWVEMFNHFKNEHIPCENLVILVEFTLRCPGRVW
ncbi:dimer_Tnp_hAT domain-containing protein [Trichonephila clavipes]|nr:dimer_Tnp_hAT domain-containing protein [Trichonephila clavipes]